MKMKEFEPPGAGIPGSALDPPIFVELFTELSVLNAHLVRRLVTLISAVHAAIVKQTDKTESVSFPQTSLAGGDKLSKKLD